MNPESAPPLADRAPVYLRFLFWSGPLIGLLLALQLEYARINKSLNGDFDRAISYISQNVSTYDVALEGFANYLALSGDVTDDEIRSYVRGIRKLYPDIYMFEISSRISHGRKGFFERSMQAKGYENFRVHGFDYKKRQPIEALPERQFYYPIRFIEPQNDQNIGLLGLDLGYGSEVLVETILAAIAKPRAIASRPFTLMEGGRGYVLYRPVPLTPKQTESRFPVSFAMLVVRGDKLLPRWLLEDSRFGVSLSYTSSIDGSIERYLIGPPSTSELFIHSLYHLTRVENIETESHPFTLKLEARVSLADVSWFNLLMLPLLGGLLSRLVCSRIDSERRRHLREQQERRQLYLKANYDPLTGLPNINLLNDLARQIQQQSARNGSIWGVLYLDLDQFKSINDQYGHDAGDQLLSQIAGRLKGTLRAEDTAARLHGDEFVVLLPELADSEATSVVIAKLQSVFTEPFQLGSQRKALSCSIGYALCPHDGKSFEVLLKVADQRMYEHKQRAENSALV